MVPDISAHIGENIGMITIEELIHSWDNEIVMVASI